MYRISLKKSGTKVPRVELDEVGPSVDFVLRRTQLANDHIIKEASRQPKATKVKTFSEVKLSVLSNDDHFLIEMQKCIMKVNLSL